MKKITALLLLLVAPLSFADTVDVSAQQIVNVITCPADSSWPKQARPQMLQFSTTQPTSSAISNGVTWFAHHLYPYQGGAPYPDGTSIMLSHKDTIVFTKQPAVQKPYAVCTYTVTIGGIPYTAQWTYTYDPSESKVTKLNSHQFSVTTPK